MKPVIDRLFFSGVSMIWLVLFFLLGVFTAGAIIAGFRNG